MIPRSINKRTNSSIVDEWELKNEEETSSAVVSKEQNFDSEEEEENTTIQILRIKI
jgi:hypothetical protein